MANAAPMAIVIDSSMVIRRARRASKASFEMGYIPRSAATIPMTLTLGKGSHTRNHTAPHASATNAIRSMSAGSRW